VSTHLGSIQDKELRIHEGIETSWLTPQKQGPSKSNSTTKESKNDFQERRKRSNQRKKQEKKVIQLEEDISKIETKQAVLDQKMIEFSTDYEQIQTLIKEQQKLEEILLEKMEQWEELSLLLSQ
jgi:hypothetical protein